MTALPFGEVKLPVNLVWSPLQAVDLFVPGRYVLKSSSVCLDMYSSKIIKATALIPDTETLLSHWDRNASVSDNLVHFRDHNVFGKASRSRVKDILAIFRQRYLGEPDVVRALAMLVQRRVGPDILRSILYFHAAENDSLLADFVKDVLFPRYEIGRRDVSKEFAMEIVGRWVREGKTTTNWSEKTQQRVAEHLLATLRDFGLLEGAAKKRIATVFLPSAAFAYIAFYLYRSLRSGHGVLTAPTWRIFLLESSIVERFMLEAHQRELLSYHAAGSVIRLDFPAETLTEYVDTIIQRAT